jgi:hypothetical protein
MLTFLVVIVNVVCFSSESEKEEKEGNMFLIGSCNWEQRSPSIRFLGTTEEAYFCKMLLLHRHFSELSTPHKCHLH